MGYRIRLLLAMLLAAACPGVGLTQEGPPKIAVLIGVNEYKHADLNRPKPLQYAENDVSELAETLRKSGYTIHLLQGKQASKQNIMATLAKARKQTADKGVFLIGLAGHGIEPEKSEVAYFVPYDADQKVGTKKGDDPWDYETMLPLSDVLDYIKTSSAGSKILLMDACRNDPTAGRGRGVGTNLKISEIPNTAVLLSCSRGQRSFEDKVWGGGHGVFFPPCAQGSERGTECSERWKNQHRFTVVLSGRRSTEASHRSSERPHFGHCSQSGTFSVGEWQSRFDDLSVG